MSSEWDAKNFYTAQEGGVGNLSWVLPTSSHHCISEYESPDPASRRKMDSYMIGWLKELIARANIMREAKPRVSVLT